MRPPFTCCRAHPLHVLQPHRCPSSSNLWWSRGHQTTAHPPQEPTCHLPEDNHATGHPQPLPCEQHNLLRPGAASASALLALLTSRLMGFKRNSSPAPFLALNSNFDSHPTASPPPPQTDPANRQLLTSSRPPLNCPPSTFQLRSQNLPATADSTLTPHPTQQQTLSAVPASNRYSPGPLSRPGRPSISSRFYCTSLRTGLPASTSLLSLSPPRPPSTRETH